MIQLKQQAEISSRTQQKSQLNLSSSDLNNVQTQNKSQISSQKDSSRSQNGQGEKWKIVGIAIILAVVCIYGTVDTFTSVKDIQTGKKEKNFVQASKAFIVPKNIWIFDESNSTQSFRLSLILKNQKRFALQSNFQILEINQTNYKNYVSEQTALKIQNIKTTFLPKLKQINKRFYIHVTKKILLSNILKSIIISHVLLQNGGISIDRQLLLTQSLDWLYNIQENPYVNRDLRENGTEVFGFYDLDLSSAGFTKNYNTSFEITKPYRMFKQLPGITLQFIAAKKNATFLRQVCKNLMKMQEDPLKQLTQMVEQQKLNDIFKKDDKYLHLTNIFTVSASHALLTKAMQFQRNEKNGDNSYDRAFNYYRVSLMNSGYGPKRLLYNLRWPARVHKWYTSLFLLQQLQNMIGKIRYCAFLTPQLHTNKEVEVINWLQQKTFKVNNGSFLQKMLFDENDKEYVTENKQKPAKINLDGPEWTSLPKKLWLIWDSGIENAPLADQLMMRKMIHKARQYGLQATLVTKANLHLYLDKEMFDKFQYVLKNAKHQIFKQTIGDLWRLGLIYKHGGIYIDSTTILLQNFDWVYFISRVQSNFLWNRFGTLPKFLGPFHHWNWNKAEQWYVDQVYNTKQSMQLFFQNSFMAAEPNSQLLRDWLKIHIQCLINPYSYFQDLLEKAGLTQYRMIDRFSIYLFGMQTFRLTVMFKQMELQAKGNTQWQDAHHYYGVWYFPKYVGMSKYRCDWGSFFNLDDPHCRQWNPFLTQYSQEFTEGLIGKARFLVKMHHQQARQFDKILISYVNTWDQIHPKSIVAKYLLSNGQRLINFDGKIQWNFGFDDI